MTTVFYEMSIFYQERASARFFISCCHIHEPGRSIHLSRCRRYDRTVHIGHEFLVSFDRSFGDFVRSEQRHVSTDRKGQSSVGEAMTRTAWEATELIPIGEPKAHGVVAML